MIFHVGGISPIRLVRIDLYDETKAELKEAESVAIATDSWTSRACESYMTVTAHFLNKN